VGNAVTRNRIRRRIRAILRTEVAAATEAIAPGLYLVGVKSNETAQISHDELTIDLQDLFSRATPAAG